MSDEKKGPKGFAGLETMTSKVEVPDLEEIARHGAVSGAPDVSASRPRRGSPLEIDEERLRQLAPKGMSSERKWMIGIGVFIALILIVSLVDSDRRKSSSSVNMLFEDVPPVGVGATHSDNQIRYCLSEDIRLMSWQTALNQYSSTAVEAFNNAITDYNARCSNYKYRRGALERVRQEVETRRGALQSDGLARASSNL